MPRAYITNINIIYIKTNMEHPMAEKYLSTTALSKNLNVEVSDLFIALQNLKWISRENDKWSLTEEGKKIGGLVKNDQKFGEYIVWPGTISFDDITKQLEKANHNLITASAIAEKVNISPQKINLIFSELGWMEKDMRGWNLTKLGKIAGGKQREHADSSKLYVLWPDSILENKSLRETFIENHIIEDTKEKPVVENKEQSFRDKFPATLRASDGHCVRSRAEVIIDNFLYNNQIIHAYERKVPIEEELYCDFYIPGGKKVYIEFWGKVGDEQYENRKKKKIELYKKNQLNLIELGDDDITKLDDILPGKLLKYEIKGYM